MDQFGQLIQSARTRQALDQAALAKQLGVTQQTVSRWETGQVRPRRAALAKLALAFDVSVGELERALQTTPTATVASPVAADAVRPLVETLPLPKLTFAQFEQFITELMQLRFRDTAVVERLGGQGDDQRGYDILVRHQDGRVTGIQCKQVKQFGKKAVQDAIAAAELEVTESVIALSRLATSAARFEAREHPGWSVWDQEDLSRQARNELSREDALRLVDSYFPGMRESFLGVRAPSPWLAPDEFFRATPTTLLDHRQALVGRQGIIDSIRDWARNGSAPIGLVVGRGGLGKSKVLYEVARVESADDPVQFRFLDVQQQPSQENFDLLPLEGKLVVVIDDAHDVENVAAIAAQLRTLRPSAKLLLATRPYGETRLDADVWRLNESRLTESRWELGDLNLDEAIKLVSELTGLPAINAATKNLASVSTDLPLIAVVGAGLLKLGDVVARSFSSDATIRRDVLGRFTELTIASGNAAETNERRQILAALAAYQPVPLGDESFQAAMTALTGIPSWDLVSARIRDLEDSGLVLRRGASVRVVPDMLGDIVLGQAAFDERSNVPTNYLHRAQNAANGLALQHLLINASRMEWQVRDGRPTRSDMLGGLWQTLRDEFFASAPVDQMQLMKVVERMAFYQPDRALALMVEVLELPEDASVDAPAERWSLTHRDVVQAIPAVLRNVAYNLEQLDGCLNVLWSLAQSDRRPTNQYPDHPLRVLTELAGLRAGKPFEYIDRVIDIAEGWFQKPYTSGLSPFDVLEPILATEGSDETSSAESITIRSFGIDPKSVHELRQRVIDMAVREARQPDPAAATRAVMALEQAVRYPMGFIGRAKSDEDVDAWTMEFIPTIEVLGDIGAEPAHDPAVRIAVRRALGSLAGDDAVPTRSKAAAKAALARAASSVEDELALCLHDGWGRLGMRDGKSYEEAEAERLASFKDVAERLIQDRSDPEVLQLVERRLVVERAAFKEGGESGRFLCELFVRRLRPGCRRNAA
jgi:transcriptional regulator with XRE-family HTH domain